MGVRDRVGDSCSPASSHRSYKQGEVGERGVGGKSGGVRSVMKYP